ncbi:hypothetical protein ACLWBD_07240 [Bdellovibrio sp. HCB117]|uniref:hypothetical protein n=1 Tax=Bdellovibrio sp. HCB117 TaxID=3394359 RepID=UPI0039B47C4A
MKERILKYAPYYALFALSIFVKGDAQEGLQIAMMILALAYLPPWEETKQKSLKNKIGHVTLVLLFSASLVHSLTMVL